MSFFPVNLRTAAGAAGSASDIASAPGSAPGSSNQPSSGLASGSAPSSGGPFSLLADPKSDIYATPLSPVHFDFNAPMLVRRLPKASFISARVTIAADWNLQFDQGGLVFAVPAAANPAPDAVNAASGAAHPAWIKAGIEVNDSRPYVSVVAKARGGWCDWSLVPLASETDQGRTASLTICRSRNALMVYHGDILVRKVPWVFLDGDYADDELGADVLVGVYAARPDPDNAATGPLEVHFSELEVQGEDEKR